MKDAVHIFDEQSYARLTIRMNGRGIAVRDRVLGVEIGTKRQFVAKAGQLVLSKIDARNGAFGVLPEECDNAIITGNFWAYERDASRLDPQFFDYLTKTRTFIDFCANASEGTTNRKYLQEAAFLAQVIALPSIPEQQRLVARVEQFISPIATTMNSRRRAETVTAELLTRAIGHRFDELSRRYENQPFGELLSRSRRVEELDPNTVYSGLGTRMWGGGVYVHETRPGRTFDAERYGVEPGQLIYNEVWAHNGAIGVVEKLGASLVVSRHFHVFDVNWTRVLPRFMTWLFRSPTYWVSCQAGSVSTTGRGHMRRSHLMNLPISVPPLAEQHRIVGALDALQAEVDALKAAQIASRAELDALLPAILDRAFAGAL